MKGIRFEDLSQKIKSSIILYQGKPIFVTDVSPEMYVHFYDLATLEPNGVKWSQAFSAPTSRLGMVNVHGSVIYASRMPERRMKLGIGKENIKFERLKVHYPDRSFDHTLYHLTKLIRQELADTLIGNYPSFKQACTYARQERGAYAFDRQFAVDSDGFIHYKTDKVGLVHKGKVVFAKKYTGLESLLATGYENH